MNVLYDAMKNGNPIGNLQNALMQIKQNPSSMLRQAGLNVPNGLSDPQQIVNYLLNSGQINQQRLATLYSVYDHLNSEKVSITANKIIEVMPDDLGDGEFEESISGKPIYPLIEILAEHMMVIKTIYPKEYRALIDQIRSIP